MSASASVGSNEARHDRRTGDEVRVQPRVGRHHVVPRCRTQRRIRLADAVFHHDLDGPIPQLLLVERDRLRHAGRPARVEDATFVVDRQSGVEPTTRRRPPPRRTRPRRGQCHGHRRESRPRCRGGPLTQGCLGVGVVEDECSRRRRPDHPLQFTDGEHGRKAGRCRHRACRLRASTRWPGARSARARRTDSHRFCGEARSRGVCSRSSEGRVGV